MKNIIKKENILHIWLSRHFPVTKKLMNLYYWLFFFKRVKNTVILVVTKQYCDREMMLQNTQVKSKLLWGHTLTLAYFTVYVSENYHPVERMQQQSHSCEVTGNS